MQACSTCHVHIESPSHFCPLCGGPLAADEAGLPNGALRNQYPDLAKRAAQYNFIVRLFLFLTLFGCVFSVLVNLLAAPNFLWCLIVIAAAVYCWLTIPPLLRRGANFAKQILFGVLLTSMLAMALDFIIGYQGWSITFVVPGLLCAGILSTCLMAVFNRTNWAQYVLYQVLIGIFGFVPLFLSLFGVPQNLAMALITAGLALGSLLFTFIFGDRTVKSEFKRRFHL